MEKNAMHPKALKMHLAEELQEAQDERPDLAQALQEVAREIGESIDEAVRNEISRKPYTTSTSLRPQVAYNIECDIILLPTTAEGRRRLHIAGQVCEN